MLLLVSNGVEFHHKLQGIIAHHPTFDHGKLGDSAKVYQYQQGW
jgi:hypothetical protein